MARRRSALRTRSLRVVGWREWVAFPDLGLEAVKAKVDTGARTSCLHAWDVQSFERDGRLMVRFNVHPIQRDDSLVIPCEAPLVDRRRVRSSAGHTQVRAVILTRIQLAGEIWETELTLTRRDVMGFRMLLGRRTLEGHFAVDPGRSFYAGTPGHVVDRLPRVEPDPGPTTTDQ